MPLILQRSLAGPTALATALAVVLGCSSLQRLSASGLERPSVALEAIAPEGLDLDGITLRVRLRVDNPNAVALDLQSLRYALSVDEAQVFEGVLPQGLKLTARGPTPVELPVRLRWLDMPRVARTFLTQPEVACKVSGSAGIGTAFGTLEVPFEHTERVPTTGGGPARP